MTSEEYIATLSVDEMRYVLLRFFPWFGNEGCPWSNDKEYECGAEENEFGERECAFDPCEQTGCWLKYYVWLYRKANAARGGAGMRNNEKKRKLLPDALAAKAKLRLDFGEFTFVPQMVFSGQPVRWEILDTRDGKPITACVSEADLKYARLFLCAPKMLKLLQRIKSSLEWCEMEGSIECETEHEIAELLDEIKGMIK